MQVRKKLDPLTSLRFFAAAMIVSGHSHRLIGSMNLANIFSFAQGVSFFFVLSGFILAYNYPFLPAKSDVLRFFKARIARIWPSHIAAIVLLFLLTGALNVGGLPNISMVLFTAIANFFLFQSAIPIKDVFLAFNGVAWSISTEFFFYLFFPLLITRISWFFKLVGVFFTLCLFLWLSIVCNISSDESLPTITLMGLLYVNPLVRLFEFFLGVVCCRVFLTKRIVEQMYKFPTYTFTLIELMVVTLALFSMWLTPRLTSFWGLEGQGGAVFNYYLVKAGSAPVFAILIFIFAFGRGFISRMLSLSPMVWLGEVSFALYLVHMPILNWYENNISHFVFFPKPVVAGLYWLLSIYIAWLLYKSIENPCRIAILKFGQIGKPVLIKIFFGGRQSLFLCLLISSLLAFKYLPGLISYEACTAECENFVSQFSLIPSAGFDRYADLLAIRLKQAPSQEGKFLEMVFRAKRITKSTHLAVHIVAKDGQIVSQIDTLLVKSQGLSDGQLWLERVLIPNRLVDDRSVGIGIALYDDPRKPYRVSYPRTDFDGRRILIDFSELKLAGTM
ncbi:acyltransferase family protein [Dentiradicibacter hellwigii]|jgi:acyltransferase 3|uniref:Acyltransferase n=1 Tax=Dentiradicibacter hellwigii TaxID=3149053 RepID=A0ABV4UGA0_9RHOO